MDEKSDRLLDPWPFDKETELKAVIAAVKAALFGESRIYQSGHIQKPVTPPESSNWNPAPSAAG